MKKRAKIPVLHSLVGIVLSFTASSASSFATETAHVTVHSRKKSGVKRAAHHTDKGVKKVVHTTDKGTKKAVHTADKGTKKVVHTADKGTKKVLHTTNKAIKKIL